MFLRIILQCLFLNWAYCLSKHPILVIVSYDAFKYNFFETKPVPNLNYLRTKGTYADYLINVFPTKTFPNHHSIATGLYPEIHGVIGNSYFNSSTNGVVGISYEMFHYDDNIVPIWRRNEDVGDGRYSGVMMWPGGCYPYQGRNVTYCQSYKPSLDWHQRIDMVISWLKNTDRPANLVMVYFEEPDTHGHIFGTNSSTVNNLIKKLDNITLYLELQLKNNNLSERAHVVHLSDHGMLNVKPEHFINVTQYLSPNSYVYAGSTPILQFIPRKGFETEIYEKLKNGSKQNGHFKVYRKEEYLSRWNYKNNPRSPPILVMADVGYGLDDLIIASKKYADQFRFNITNESEFGVHGYDYTESQMRPFFMVRGPKIKKNNKIPPFHTVDLYNLFCNILEITPLKNNGTPANIADILITGNGKYSLSSLLIITAGGIFIALVLIGCAAVITIMMIKRQQSITTTAALNKRFPQTFQSSIEAQHLLEPEDA